MGVVPFWPKSPTANCACAVDFADELPTGVTLSSCSVSARKYRDGTDATSTLLAGGTNATCSGSVAAILVGAGSLGTMYELLFRATLSDGQVLPETIGRVKVDL